MRSRVGTTLLWNTDVLDPDQRKNWILEARLNEGEQWFCPKICTPIIKDALQSVMDDNTAAIMIPHQVTGRINELTPFEVRITFGTPPNIKDSYLKIESQNSYVPYVKPQRFEVHNRTIYAEPVYLMGLAPDVLDQIVTAVSNKLKSPKSEEPPKT
jgi:hypothetical protein